jgi:hypothetical protein
MRPIRFAVGVLSATLVALAAAQGSPASAGIACTQAAFETALSEACSGGSKTITFDASCRGATIPFAPGTRARREILCDGVVVDGQDLGVTLEMTPAWWADARCDTNGDTVYADPCDSNADGQPDACPEHEAGDWFLMVRGNGVTVQNLTVRHFYDGIHFDDATHGNAIRNVTFVKHGDDSFTNEAGAYGNTFAGSTVLDNCDKGIQLYGRDVDTSSGYDVEVLDSTFVNVSQPIRGTQTGRFLVRGNTIRQDAGVPSLFRCEGPRFDGFGSAVYWQANVVDGCARGLRIAGRTHLVMTDGNTFRNNRVKGLLLYDNANGSPRGHVQDSTFTNNGGTTSSETGFGGIAVKGSAQLDAGGGSLVLDGVARTSLGRNTFDRNRSATDPTLDLDNLSTGTVLAESGWWGDTDPSDQVTGTVDWSPPLSGPPGSSTAPEAPANLRREDAKP